jgi:CRISPR/Cas system-associated protein Csx1
MAEMDKFRAEVKALARQGVDVEVIKRLVEDAYGKVLDDVKRILDQRIAHIISVIDEQGNEVRDALDLINEILRSEIEIGEKIEELRNMLSEEKIEELLYKALIKHGVIKRRRRRWAPLIAGLSILAAIIVGLVVNPIATLVILFITFVILMRW